MRIFQAVEQVTDGAGAARVSAIFRKPLFGEHQVGLGYRDLAGLLGDAVPESLQIADLLRLREGAEPDRFGEGRRFPPALSWS
jgi:hypothetical protein